MRIQAINTNYDKNYPRQQQTGFKGFFMRVGTGHKTLTPNYYSNVAYIPYKNGNSKLASNTYKDKQIWVFSACKVTAEQAKSAYSFLFEKVQNAETYEAAKMLKSFVASLADKDTGEHNVLYMEKEDSGIPKKENWKELNLSNIVSTLNKYERDNNIIKPTSESAQEPQLTFTIDELWEMIHRNGVA